MLSKILKRPRVSSQWLRGDAFVVLECLKVENVWLTSGRSLSQELPRTKAAVAKSSKTVKVFLEMEGAKTKTLSPFTTPNFKTDSRFSLQTS